MRRIKSAKDLPLFPLVPLLPAAVLVGSLVTSIKALTCVRRLEKRLNTATPAP